MVDTTVAMRHGLLHPIETFEGVTNAFLGLGQMVQTTEGAMFSTQDRSELKAEWKGLEEGADGVYRNVRYGNAAKIGYLFGEVTADTLGFFAGGLGGEVLDVGVDAATELAGPALRSASTVARKAGMFRRRVVINPRLENFKQIAKEFLGENYTMKLNKSGDPVFVNVENTKRIRFDVQNPHGDQAHGHVEVKVQNRWKDYTAQHRIYIRNNPVLDSQIKRRPKL